MERKLRVTSRSQLLVHLFVAYATRADSGGKERP
jgi:hypothetical protein